MRDHDPPRRSVHLHRGGGGQSCGICGWSDHGPGVSVEGEGSMETNFDFIRAVDGSGVIFFNEAQRQFFAELVANGRASVIHDSVSMYIDDAYKMQALGERPTCWNVSDGL